MQQINKLTTQNQQQAKQIYTQAKQIYTQAEQIRDQKLQIDELVNVVAVLKEENQLLRDEIAILKGQKPRLKIPPSKLEGAKSKDKQANKLPRGKHPRKKKKTQLSIHTYQRIKPKFVPPGAVFKGYKKFTVQDIILQSHNTVYELERWQLPDGTYMTGQLPQSVHGHYGPQLVAYVLYQYYGCRVTEPLILNQLREIGVHISSGQLSNILTQNKERYHEEKNELLAAGIAAMGQIQVDDTGARHSGQNGYSTIIGNQFFTFVDTTESKSRENFLRVLHGTNPNYLINQDACDYLETLQSSTWLQGYLALNAFSQAMNQVEWERFLQEINITSEKEVKVVTEAALFASLIEKGIPRDLGIHGDDAGQFDIFVRSLCWIHEERHYRKIIPMDENTRQEIEQVQDGIWVLYKGLQEYKKSPSEPLRIDLDREFDLLFLKNTSSPTLNKRLRNTYAKKGKLLRVLERPETPLHNNSTETDAREIVVKRKVSGGTRSYDGKRCRDTFVSLKKTCCKLGINFWGYLQDRTNKTFAIPKLNQVIAMQSTAQPEGP